MASARRAVLFWLGYAYVRNVHVRIDVFTGHLTPRQQAWLEIFGIVCLRHPLLLVATYYAYVFVEISFLQNETSDAPNGLGDALDHQGLPVPRPGPARRCGRCRCCCASWSSSSGRPIWPPPPSRRPYSAEPLRETIMEWIGDHLAVLMFLVLTFIMFVGYPVAFVLGGVALGFGALGIMFDVFRPAQFGSLMPRIFGQAVQNPVLIAVPMFVFMGTILEKSGIADELLKALQVLTRRIPGGLAMSVTLMGTIMAATTGIVGASVIMLTLIALPTMLEPATPRSCRSAPSPRPERSAS